MYEIITHVPTDEQLIAGRIARLTEKGATDWSARTELEKYLASFTAVPTHALSLSDLVAKFGIEGAKSLLERVSLRAQMNDRRLAQAWYWTRSSLNA